MPATPIAAATRYFQPEITKVLILPTVAAATLTPTRAELNAGTDVSPDVASWSGWTVSTAQIATPDLGKRFTSSIPGRITVDDSSITFYADLAGADIRDVLIRDADQYVAILDGGDVTGRNMDVFKTTVGSVGKLRDLEDAPRITVSFTIRAYAENLAVPTAV